MTIVPKKEILENLIITIVIVTKSQQKFLNCKYNDDNINKTDFRPKHYNSKFNVQKSKLHDETNRNCDDNKWKNVNEYSNNRDEMGYDELDYNSSDDEINIIYDDDWDNMMFLNNSGNKDNSSNEINKVYNTYNDDHGNFKFLSNNYCRKRKDSDKINIEQYICLSCDTKKVYNGYYVCRLA